MEISSYLIGMNRTESFRLMSSRYLLDTNIISELCRARPQPSVVDFVAALDRFWLSVITIHELRFGIELLPLGEKRTRLHETIQQLTGQYQTQLVEVDKVVAALAGEFRAQARLTGKTVHLADALIAASCAGNNEMVLVTRNVADFAACPIETVNPFS